MNLQHMKYAIVIAQTQSINKAAEQLYVGQPTLSRAIKELEGNLGITLFERSTKGMTLTADGELFIRCAKNVLAQVDDIEKMFGREGTAKRRFSLSAPRAGYVYEAFVRFSCEVGEDTQAELVYRAADTMGALADVEQGRSALGVVRYASHADRYYKEMMEEKGLVCELVAEFRMGILVSRSSPLARRRKLGQEDLRPLMEIFLSDTRAAAPVGAENHREEPSNLSLRQLYLHGGNPLEILSRNPQTYVWSAPLPKEQQERYGLVWLEASWRQELYRDVLVRQKDYLPTRLDGQFTDQLIAARREVIN